MKVTQLSAVIADDEPLLRYHLNNALADFWPELEIVAIAENGQQALDMIKEHQPDIAFLDIKMPLMDGMSVAKSLVSQNIQTHVVFVTAYDEFALQAFETNAVDYLLKPLSDKRLEQSILKLKSRLEQEQAITSPDMALLMGQIQALTTQKKPNYLTWIKASKGEEIHLISMSDVLYFKTEDKYVSLFKNEQGEAREYVLRTSLRELMSQLDPDAFWQIHRSTVVNVSAIDKVRKDLRGRMEVSIGSARLPVSRAMQSQFSNHW
jgi:DNA-binding LytR/AlgR family response regulator